jgi:tRNA pseudouridine65 synthase
MASPQRIPFLFHDADMVVVNKPSGLLVHRGWGRDDVTLIDLLKVALPGQPIHTVHRLDRGTSGALLVALNPETARDLSKQIESHSISKSYLALVRGRFTEPVEVNHPLAPQKGAAKADATTRCEPFASAPSQPRETSLIWAHPQTGRTHQIRRHLKHLNHPILGDVNYGKGPLNRAARSRYDLHRLALHAYTITFRHPRTQNVLCITAPLPDDLSKPLIAMGYEEALKRLK